MFLRPLLVIFALAPVADVPAIRTFGTVKSLVEQRDDAPKTTLTSVLGRAHAYGVGSLSGLRGEITIVDGTAWLAYPPADAHGTPRVTTDGNGAEQAAFLAVAYVAPNQWQKIELGGALTSDALDDAIAKLAADHGLRGADFPFRIEGRLQKVIIAIVDGRRLPPGPGSEAIMKKANVLETESGVSASLVGFYSAASDGRFTHEGAHTHVHVVVPQKHATGHASTFTVDRGAILYLPSAPPPA